MSACQNCGKEVTNRNKRHFTTFLDKPLCAKWKPCFYRKTGKSFRPRYKLGRTGPVGGSREAAKKFNEIAVLRNEALEFHKDIHAIRERIPHATAADLSTDEAVRRG